MLCAVALAFVVASLASLERAAKSMFILHCARRRRPVKWAFGRYASSARRVRRSVGEGALQQ